MSATLPPQKRCRAATCNAAIRFVPNRAGKLMALNAEPDRRRGNVWVHDLDGEIRAQVVSGDAARALRRAGEPMYLDHHANCADAARFRRA